MRNKTLRWKTIVLCSIMFCLPKTPLAGQESSGFIHRLGMEARPQYVFPTNPFLQGENERWKPIQTSFAAHLKYSFKFRPNTCADRIYGGAYQGIGVSLTTFGDKNSWAILSHSMCFKEHELPVSLPVSRSIMSGISVCPPDGSHTTIIIIPIMVRSVHG